MGDRLEPLDGQEGGREEENRRERGVEQAYEGSRQWRSQQVGVEQRRAVCGSTGLVKRRLPATGMGERGERRGPQQSEWEETLVERGEGQRTGWRTEPTTGPCMRCSPRITAVGSLAGTPDLDCARGCPGGCALASRGIFAPRVRGALVIHATVRCGPPTLEFALHISHPIERAPVQPTPLMR